MQVAIHKLLQTLRAQAVSLATVLMWFLAIFAIYHLIEEISYDTLVSELRNVPGTSLGWSVLAMSLSFVAMTGYDWSALRYIGQRLPYRTVALASFAGYAIGNSIGFSLISGGSVRFRIYATAGLDGSDVARVSAFCALALGIGVQAVGAIALAWDPEILAEILPLSVAILRATGFAATLLLIGLFVFMARRREWVLGRWRIALPSWQLGVTQLGISLVDILFAGLCLYALLPDSSVPFMAFLLVFSMATVAGVLSHVPGGLGVFEGVMLFALRQHVSTETLTAALLLYRAIYYLLPLLLATAILVAREISDRAQPALAVARQIGAWGAHLVPPVSAGLIFINGLVLLLSSATPAAPGRLEFIADAIPLLIVEVSYVLGAMVGLSLLVLARGLYRRLNGAYWLALLAIGAGVAVSLIKAVDYEEATILGITGLVLVLCRREFYRHTTLLNAPFTGSWLLAAGAAVGGMVWIILFSYKHVEYSHLLWWQFGYGEEAPRAMRAGLGALIGLAALGLWTLLRPPRQPAGNPDPATLARADVIVRRQGFTLPELVLLGDKSVLFNEFGTAFLMYGVRGSSWIGLGDPVGPEEAAEELAWRFRELVDRQAGRIAFYQIRAENLPIYLDMGLMPLKLGEEATVLLPQFSLVGPSNSDHRYTLRKAEKEGLSVEILATGQFAAYQPTLQAISDTWLLAKGTREKRFSLGAFDPAYISRFPIAVVRRQDAIVAFANLWETDTRDEASLDLMRYNAEAPALTMHYLFVKLLLHYQGRGFQRFNLGMAPLSGLESHPLSPLWHRFGSLLYNRGAPFYNFQGLRRFKEKFHPVWEPRYLASLGGLQPAVVLSDVAALISGGMKGLFGR
jgi:phosphatidylglycerol lysyltransferase